jgi:hypothetical protein
LPSARLFLVARAGNCQPAVRKNTGSGGASQT